MKFFSPTSILATTFIAALLAGCGPGSPGDETDDPAPPAPEWAFGWWLTASNGLQSHPQWGTFILQMEIRSDGTVLQMVDYCNGEDWIHESRWELQSNGSIRIIPSASEGTVPFQDWTAEYEYVEIQPSNGSCTTTATRVVGDVESETTIERGRWCIGAYDESINDCPLQKYCGEEAPACE
jgi:hypothetical protein